MHFVMINLCSKFHWNCIRGTKVIEQKFQIDGKKTEGQENKWLKTVYASQTMFVGSVNMVGKIVKILSHVFCWKFCTWPSCFLVTKEISMAKSSSIGREELQKLAKAFPWCTSIGVFLTTSLNEACILSCTNFKYNVSPSPKQTCITTFIHNNKFLSYCDLPICMTVFTQYRCLTYSSIMTTRLHMVSHVLDEDLRLSVWGYFWANKLPVWTIQVLERLHKCRVSPESWMFLCYEP